MRYRPAPSVTAERVRSISASLIASTRTPGNRAPDESVTEPAMAACPNAVEAEPVTQTSITIAIRRIRNCEHILV